MSVPFYCFLNSSVGGLGVSISKSGILLIAWGHDLFQLKREKEKSEDELSWRTFSFLLHFDFKTSRDS